MNLFDIPEKNFAKEIVDILGKSDNVRIERILSSGHTTDWYDQEQEEFVILLSGEAVLEFENGDKLKLCKGDNLVIKAHEKHRVVYTSSEPVCVWLCVFY